MNNSTENQTHTPGPWAYSKCACGDPKCRSYAIDHSGAEGMFSEADARLIAAAPVLLEALKTAIELGGEEMNALEILRELVEVADLRGDKDLPAPADDPRMWTARMRDAWDAADAILADQPFANQLDTIEGLKDAVEQLIDAHDVATVAEWGKLLNAVGNGRAVLAIIAQNGKN